MRGKSDGSTPIPVSSTLITAVAPSPEGETTDIEQIVDQPRQMLGLACDHVPWLRRLPRMCVGMLQEAGGDDDRARGGAQLVAEHREKFVLGAARGDGTHTRGDPVRHRHGAKRLFHESR